MKKAFILYISLVTSGFSLVWLYKNSPLLFNLFFGLFATGLLIFIAQDMFKKLKLKKALQEKRTFFKQDEIKQELMFTSGNHK